MNSQTQVHDYGSLQLSDKSSLDIRDTTTDTNSEVAFKVINNCQTASNRLDVLKSIVKVLLVCLVCASVITLANRQSDARAARVSLRTSDGLGPKRLLLVSAEGLIRPDGASHTQESYGLSGEILLEAENSESTTIQSTTFGQEQGKTVIEETSWEVEEPKNHPPINTTFHLWAHSHQDLGWLVTEDEYYHKIVERVISSMVEYMHKDDQCKFIFADLGFLYMHLKKHPDQVPAIQKLLDTGRLEFVNGGFVLNDHATVSLDDFLSNFQYGKSFINRHFKVDDTKVIWAIDQFGLSLTGTKIAADLGYQGQVLNRISTSLMNKMKQNADLLFDWQPDNYKNASVRTYVFPNHYQLFDSIDFDKGLQGNIGIPTYNILNDTFSLHIKLGRKLDQYKIASSFYKTSHIPIPFGGDFAYADFELTYGLVKMTQVFVRSNSKTGRYVGIDAKSSTPKEYFAAVKAEEKQRDLKLARKIGGDFMPLVEQAYDTDNRAAWSGYFTTNPYSKKVLRSMGDVYRGLRSQLAFTLGRVPPALAQKLSEIVAKTNNSEWIVAANQHHDTMTGTSKHSVSEHYLTRQQNELNRAAYQWKDLLKQFLKAVPPAKMADQLSLHAANGASQTQQSERYGSTQPPSSIENEIKQSAEADGWEARFKSGSQEHYDLEPSTQYLLMNQIATQTHVVRFSSSHLLEAVIVIRSNGTQERIALTEVNKRSAQNIDLFSSEIEAVMNKSSYVFGVELTSFENVMFELVPFVQNLVDIDPAKPLIPSVMMTEIDEVGFRLDSNGTLYLNSLELHLGIGVYCYFFDKRNNKHPSDKPDVHEFWAKEKGIHSPGKYIFTTTADPTLMNPSSVVYMSEKDGSLSIRMVYEDLRCSVHFIYLPWAKTTDRYSTTVNCQERFDYRDFDLVLRYSSDIDSKSKFYTDSNGLYAIERQRGKYGPYIEANYYPLTSFIMLQDNKKRLAVMVDRAEGGTSPSDGVLELMVHRQGGTDDGRGVGESATEGKPIQVLHRIIIENKSPGPDHLVYRDVQAMIDSPVTLLELVPIAQGLKFEILLTPRQHYSLPSHTRLLLDTDERGQVFVRLYNLHDHNEVDFDVDSLIKIIFSDWQNITLVEVPIDFIGETIGGQVITLATLETTMIPPVNIPRASMKAFKIDRNHGSI